MSATLQERPITCEDAGVRPFRWNALTYQRLFDVHILEGNQYELIDGEIFQKMPTKKPHQLALHRLFRRFSAMDFDDRVFTQGTVEAGIDSMPDPDLYVVKPNAADMDNGKYFQPSSVLHVTEVSETTLRNDLSRKARMYANAQIPEYWVIDLEGRQVHVHTNPIDGIYESITVHAETETIVAHVEPDVVINISDILPPIMEVMA